MRYPTDDNENRIRGVLDEMIGIENSDDLMVTLLEAIQNSYSIIPNIGSYYTFIYSAKTPNIQYDQHPLVRVTGLYRWGFVGWNYHWRKYRKYTWEELNGSLYEIYPEELSDARELKIAKILLNN
jgi:hypothetical protein